MKRINYLLLITIIFFYVTPCFSESLDNESEVVNEVKKTQEKIIRFHYDNEDLVDVINSIAGLKDINIVLPVGPNAIPPEMKVTLHMQDKVAIDEAWDLLCTILDVAGYSMVERGLNTFVIVKTSNQVTKGAWPVYVSVKPEDLPDTDQRIRYVYFMANIKVSGEAESELQGLLRGLLPQGTSAFSIDPSSNALIITAKSNVIKSVMNIVQLLEKTTYKEKMESLTLEFNLASIVANLFNGENGILKSPNERQRYGVDAKKPREATYFSKYVKIIAYDRTNTLIIVGREEAVERIKSFVQKYIDVPVESGKSILHVYKLQYLDAATFAEVLQKIVDSAAAGGTGQSQAEGSAPATIERYFEGVIVKSDAPDSLAGSGEEEAGGIYRGNNNLIIAARNEDWKRIKKLIEELDVPQPQVILQVLVADMNLGDVRLIGSWVRNPEKFGFPKGFDFQAANLDSQFVMVDNYDEPTTLAPDLLQQYYDSDGNVPGQDQSFANIVAPNSTLISFNDCDSCKTWAILQMINTLNYRKVLSMPHVIAVNNKQAEIVIGEERFVKGAAVGNQGGTVTATQEWVNANLTLTLTPRIAFGQDVEKLTLDINVKIEDFQSTTNFANANRFTREFKTISIIKSGEVIALGGLSRLADTSSIRQTPVLGQIPILGYFFKTRQSDTPQENLTVFIRPTIVMPKLRGGMGDYTQNYIKLTKQYTKEGMLFDSLKDPITRWFFKLESNIDEAIDDFVANDELKTETFDEEIAGDAVTVVDAKKAQVVKPKSKHSKVAARREKRGLFFKRDNKLEKLLSDQENPFESA